MLNEREFNIEMLEAELWFDEILSEVEDEYLGSRKGRRNGDSEGRRGAVRREGGGEEGSGRGVSPVTE